MIECTLILRYDTEKKAKAVFGSVENENEGYLDCRIEGSTLVFEISSENPMSLSHTVNDLLACVKAAESSLEI